MDINEFLNNGVTVPNPNYKKPSRKNPAGSPRFIQSTDFNVAEDRGTRVGLGLAENSYDLTSLGNNENQYDTHNVRINPVNTIDELNQSRAKNQSFTEQLGRFAIQSVGNEIVLGTALGLSNLVDAAINITKKSGENDYTNSFSTFLEQKQDEIKKRFEIYRQNPDDKFAIGDTGWWTDNAISVASTLSLLAPSMAVTEGLGALAKVGKLEKVSMGIAKAAKGLGITEGATTLAKAINEGSKIGLSAALSRTMENYQEARGVYKEVYDKSLDKLNNMSVDDKAELLKNNPDFIGMSNEDMAKQISGRSADETFKNDYAMLLMDFMQFKALGSMWKGAVNKEANAALRLANKAAIEELAGNAGETTTKMGFLAKRKEALQYLLKNPLTSIEAAQLSEGFEEGYQGIQTEKGKEVAERIFDPSYKNKDLESYLSDSNIWEQAFWGAVGGIAFQAAGTGLGNVSKYVKGKIDKGKMTEQEYAISQMTDEKIRQKEIEGRSSLLKNFSESMQLLNQGKNPYGYKLDPDTKQPILNDGSKVNEDIGKDEAELLKTKLTNDFVTDMTMNAIDAGNYDLFKEYISDPNFNKFFNDAGLEENTGDKRFSELVTQKMNDVYEQYGQSLYDILNSVDVKNENVAKIVARNIARRKLQLQDLYNASDDIKGEIINNADTSDYSDYEDEQRTDYVQNALINIKGNEIKVKTLLDNKQISQQAYDQIVADNNNRRKQLLGFLSDNKLFANRENVKAIIDNNIKDADVDGFYKEYEDYLKDSNNNSNKPSTPKKTIQDLIKKKIELDDHADYINYSIPTTQAEYQNEYNDIAMHVDKLTIDRYNKAADIVGKYLEDHSNLDEARDNIMTNNVPNNIKDSLDILKLGHHSTSSYTSQINAIIKELVNDREKAAQEAKNVTVDNITRNDNKAENEILDLNGVNNQVDAREQVSNSNETNISTGEEVQSNEQTPQPLQSEVVKPNEVVPNYNVNEEISTLDKVTDQALAKQENDFILDNDSRATGLASSITFDLFRNSKNLFDNLEGKDVNSAEFNNLVDIVSDELFSQGVSRGLTRQSAIEGVRLAMNTIYRRLNNKGIDGADKFRRLASELATKQYVDPKASTTKLIPNTEFNKVVDDFINIYIDNKGIYTLKGSKTIINVEDLFNELLNDSEISYEEAKHIFYNIADYINANNNKYIFTNKTNLNKNLKTPSIFFNNLINNKTTIEVVDHYMHVAAPTQQENGYYKAVADAISGKPVDISYKGSNTNSISISIDGVEIGYLASVKSNNVNTGYSLVAQNQGFVYNITNNNGIIISNLDNFFISTINKSDENYAKLMDLVYKHYAYTIANKNGELTSPPTAEEYRSILNNKVIKDILGKELLIPNYDRLKIDSTKGAYILDKIANIIFFNKGATTPANIIESYNYWKANTYNNYRNTYKIQQALNKNQKFKTKLVNIGTGDVLLDPTNHNINSRGFTYEQNPVVIVDANGNIINESNKTVYNNAAGFTPGSMGVMLRDNPNAPVLALFTEANTLRSNFEMANNVEKEITNLLNGFQNKEIDFNTLGNSFSDLFSGPGVASNNLFSGYSVIKTSDKIALNIQGQKGKYNLIIHKFEKGSNKEGSGITYIPKGDVSKSASTINTNTNINAKIAKEIVDNLVFNKTFYAINNKNKDNDKSNKYIYKQNGKLVINIGGVINDYNNFSHFVLDNNAFKTNQGISSTGSYFDVSSKIKTLNIDTAIINSPVEETINDTAADIIKTATKTESVNTNQVLIKAGVAQDQVAVLTGTNQFNIELIPKQVYFDNKATKAEAYYSNGKMFFTNKGANAIIKSPANLVRLLLHENLHAKFEEQGLFEQAGIVDDLLDTYQQMINAINNDTTSKEATVIRKWVLDNKFNPDEYFSTLSVEQQRIWDKRNKEQKDKQFAEEWLVESLTQPAIIRYLNNTIYNGQTINVEGINNNNKTIWQRIIDVLLKLFNKNSGDIKNNTILAQQYAILGNRSDIEQTTEDYTNNEVKLNADTVDPIANDIIAQDATKQEINTTPKEPTINDYKSDNKLLDEDSDVEDLDFAVTNIIDDVDQINIDNYNNNSNVNMNGVQVVNDMNDFINQFSLQDKPIIGRMIAANEIKFRCE